MSVGARAAGTGLGPVPFAIPTRFHCHTSDGGAYPLSAAADFLAEAGFDALDLSLDTLSPWDDARESVLYAFGRRAAEAGLSVPVCHLSLYMPDPSDRAAMARFAGWLAADIRAAAELSVPDAVLHPVARHGSVCGYPAWIEENLAFLSPLRELAARTGVRLCLENMAGVPYPDRPDEPVYGSRAAHLLTLAERLDADLCWDTGHARLTGIRQSSEIRQLGNRLRVLHVHDNDGRQDLHLLPGEGSVDFDDVAAGLRAIGFLGLPDRCLVLETRTSDLPADRRRRLAFAASALDAARALTDRLLTLA